MYPHGWQAIAILAYTNKNNNNNDKRRQINIKIDLKEKLWGCEPD
jgi:hypothetical protein